MLWKKANRGSWFDSFLSFNIMQLEELEQTDRTWMKWEPKAWNKISLTETRGKLQVHEIPPRTLRSCPRWYFWSIPGHLILYSASSIFPTTSYIHISINVIYKTWKMFCKERRVEGETRGFDAACRGVKYRRCKMFLQNLRYLALVQTFMSSSTN